MKKLWIALVFAVLLCGCSAEQTFETLSDMYHQPVITPQTIDLTLPKEASAQVVQSDTEEKLYLCDGYVLTVQTFSSGDLNHTLQQLTGRNLEQLMVMQTQQGDAKCFRTV